MHRADFPVGSRWVRSNTEPFQSGPKAMVPRRDFDLMFLSA
jgi:hypothetical protein